MNNDLSHLRKSWRHLCSSPKEISCATAIIHDSKRREDESQNHNIDLISLKQTNFNKEAYDLPPSHPLGEKNSGDSQEELDEYDLWLKKQLKEAEREFNRLSALTESLSAHDDVWAAQLEQKKSISAKQGVNSQRYCTTHNCIHDLSKPPSSPPLELLQNTQPVPPEQLKQGSGKSAEHPFVLIEPRPGDDGQPKKAIQRVARQDTQRSNRRSSFTLRPPLRTAPILVNELLPHKQSSTSIHNRPIFNSIKQYQQQDSLGSLPAVYFDHKKESQAEALVVKTTIFQKANERTVVDVKTETKEVQTLHTSLSHKNLNHNPFSKELQPHKVLNNKSESEAEVDTQKSITLVKDVQKHKLECSSTHKKLEEPTTLNLKQSGTPKNNTLTSKIESKETNKELNIKLDERPGQNTETKNQVRTPPQLKPRPSNIRKNNTQYTENLRPNTSNQPKSPQLKVKKIPSAPNLILNKPEIKKQRTQALLSPSNPPKELEKSLQTPKETPKARPATSANQENKSLSFQPKPLPPKKPNLGRDIPKNNLITNPNSAAASDSEKPPRQQIGDYPEANNTPKLICEVSSESSTSTMSRKPCGCPVKPKSNLCVPSSLPSRWFWKRPQRKVNSTFFPAEGDNMNVDNRSYIRPALKQGNPCGKSCRCGSTHKKNPWTLKWNNCSDSESEEGYPREKPKKPPCCCCLKKVRSAKKCCRPLDASFIEGKSVESQIQKIKGPCNCKCSKYRVSPINANRCGYSMTTQTECFIDCAKEKSFSFSNDGHLCNYGLDSPSKQDDSFERAVNELCMTKQPDPCQFNIRCPPTFPPSCLDPSTLPIDALGKPNDNELSKENTDTLEKELEKIRTQMEPVINTPQITTEPPKKSECKREAEQLYKKIMQASEPDLKVGSDNSIKCLLKQLREKCEQRKAANSEHPTLPWKTQEQTFEFDDMCKPSLPCKNSALVRLCSSPKQSRQALSPKASCMPCSEKNISQIPGMEGEFNWCKMNTKCSSNCMEIKTKCFQISKKPIPITCVNSNPCSGHISDATESSCKSFRESRIKAPRVKFSDYCGNKSSVCSTRRSQVLPRSVRQKLAISNYCSLLCKVDTSDSENEDEKFCNLKTCTEDLTYLVGLAQGLLGESPDCILKFLMEGTHTQRQAYLARCFGAILDKIACLMENWKQVSKSYYRALDCMCGAKTYQPQDMKTIWRKHHNIFLQALDIAVKGSV